VSAPRQDVWLEQPVDPDPAKDLGYEIVPWDVVAVESGDSDHRVVLPTDEAMLMRDAFMIIPSSMIWSLEDHR
jgi:hypothetical protein